MSAESPKSACSVGKLCQRDVVSIEPQEDIVTAATRMREHHVGCLFVTEPIPNSVAEKVIGVLTDRDIVVSVVARNAAPSSLKVGDVMTRNPLLVNEDASIDSVLSFMRDAGVRRVAVTGAQGELIGVLALDDVIARLAEQLVKISGSIQNERNTERMVRS